MTTLKRKKPLRRQSKKRAKESREYMQKRKAFLEVRPLCEVWLDVSRLVDSKPETYAFLKEIFGRWYGEAVPSQDIHHTAGRLGGNYLDESTWMAVSSKAHRWIHDHPKQAKEWGWLK